MAVKKEVEATSVKKEVKATPVKKEVKATPAKKEKAPGVGTVACQLIEKGDSKHISKVGQPKTFMTNQEVLELVLKRFPEAKTKLASINWYRNDLRIKGKNVPQNREIVKDRKNDGVKTVAKKGVTAVKSKKTSASNLV